MSSGHEPRQIARSIARRWKPPWPFIGGAAIAMALLGVPRSGAVFVDSTDSSANSFGADTLDPPTALSATSGVSLDLDWTATVDTYAAGHRILRSSSSGGPYTQIAEVTPRSLVTYSDSSAEGTYYYVARSFDGAWESGDSNEVSGRIWRAFDCPSNPDLRACIRFDTDVSGTYADESGNANTVTHSGGAQIDGISDQAIDGTPGSHYEIADSASLDLTTAMTLEAWLRVDSLPTSGRVGILDNDGQYALFLYSGTGLRCSTTIDALPHIPVTTGAWFHVACTWDGTTLTMYLDGVQVASMASSGTIDTSNTNPISLLNSSPLWDEPADAAMDNLRIWHTARTQAQICADAGISGC